MIYHDLSLSSLLNCHFMGITPICMFRKWDQNCQRLPTNDYHLAPLIFFLSFISFGGASRAPKSPINIKVWMEYLQIHMGFRWVIYIYIHVYVYIYMGYKPFTNWFSVTLGWLDTLIHFIRGWLAKKCRNRWIMLATPARHHCRWWLSYVSIW